MTNSIFTFIILRFLYGFIYGFSLPLSISMVSEIIPVKYRGKAIILTNFCVSLGKVWGIFLAYLTFENLNQGNWRLMMCLCSITPLLVVLGIFFFVKESPRFLLSIKNYNKAFDVIDNIGAVNFSKKDWLKIEQPTKQEEMAFFNASLLKHSLSNKNSLLSQTQKHSLSNNGSYAFPKDSIMTFEDDLEKFDNFNLENLQERENSILHMTTSIYSSTNKANQNIFEKKNSEQNPKGNEAVNYNKLINDSSNISNTSPEAIQKTFNLFLLKKNELFYSSYKKLTDWEKNAIKNFYNNNFYEADTASCTVLFKSNVFSITMRIWVCWFALIFVEFGQYVILPFILISQSSGFGTLLLAIMGEIPSIALSTIIIDYKNLGRRNSLALFMLVMIIINLLIYVSEENYFGILISAERFIMKNSFSMLVPLTSELYPTNFRTIGYGFATGVGRFAATICPYILFPLLYWNVMSSFLLFSLLSLFAFIASFTMLHETSGKHLDTLLLENNEIC